MWIVGCETDLYPGYIWKASPIYLSPSMAENRWNERFEDKEAIEEK